jgi:hypothetical protein
LCGQRLSERVDWAVAEAMLRAAEAVGVKGQVYITAPVEHGQWALMEVVPWLTHVAGKWGTGKLVC